MTQPEAPGKTLNFQGVMCPYNYVKTRLAMEEMQIGQVLEVLLDPGEPERHVPQSITNDGQEVLRQFTDEEGRVHIIIKKTVEY